MLGGFVYFPNGYIRLLFVQQASFLAAAGAVRPPNKQTFTFAVH